MKRKATIYRKKSAAAWTYWMVVKGLNFIVDEATALMFVNDGRAKLVTA